jgi:TolB protein
VHTVVGTACNISTAHTAQLHSAAQYGAMSYQSRAKALAALKAAPFAGPPALEAKVHRGPSHPVALGNGVVGKEYTTGGGQIDWASGQWRFSADYSDCSVSLASNGLLAAAKAMVALARSHPLPDAPGLVAVYDACGDALSYSGSVTWVDGADLYSTDALGSCSVPMLLAASMQPYVSGTATPSASPLPRGQQLPISKIPWAEVGPGWSLAMLNFTGPTPPIVYVVDPAGGRYRVPGSVPPPADIIGWSGDKKRALMVDDVGGGVAQYFELNLTTGERFDSFDTTSSYSFTLPDGQALLELVSNLVTGASKLVRTNLAGAAELTFPTTFPGPVRPTPTTWPVFNGTFLETPDGTEVVMGANLGMALVSNEGKVVLPLYPPALGSCAPVEWWQPQVVLSDCKSQGANQDQYWLVPISGVKPTLFGPVGGTNFVWDVGGEVYSQTYSGQKNPGCGAIVKLTRGVWRPATLPGAKAGYPTIVGAYGDQLELMWESIACGSNSTANGSQLIMWSDPSTHTSSVLLGPPLTDGFVQSVVPYPTTAEIPA